MGITREKFEGYPFQKRCLAQMERPGRFSQMLLFAANYLKHPKMVGGLVPSSRFLVDRVLKQIDWARARVIVEYGPGVGVFTRRILQCMTPDAKLVVLEINAEFLEFLNGSLTDPRLHLVQDSAADIDRVLQRLGLSQADYVISGIPFSPMPSALRENIVRKTYSVLRPGGRFLVYQCSGAVRPYLERCFSQVSCAFHLLNVLPTRLFFCAP